MTTIYENQTEPIIRTDDLTFRKIKGKKILVLKPHRRKRFAGISKTSERFYRSLTFAQAVLEETPLRKYFEQRASKTVMTAFYEASYFYRDKIERE